MRRGEIRQPGSVAPQPPPPPRRRLLESLGLAWLDVEALLPKILQNTGSQDFSLESLERPLESVVFPQNDLSQTCSS